MDWNPIGKIRAWLLEENVRPERAPRTSTPDLVAHYWGGSSPEGRPIRDISQTGAYIYTTDQWFVGTVIRIIFQVYPAAARRDDAPKPEASICVAGRVVRQGPDGLGVQFLFSDNQEAQNFRNFLAENLKQATTTAQTASRKKGQALIEFALLIPLVFLLAVNAVNFGGFIFAWITVANAARAGAQYMVLSSNSPGSPTPATLAQVTTLVTNDVTSLLNRSSVVVAICTNKTTSSTACTTLSDPEAPTYTLATVDVTYTYVPYIPLFSFPRLNISATLPSTTIHRKAVMRMIQ